MLPTTALMGGIACPRAGESDCPLSCVIPHACRRVSSPGYRLRLSATRCHPAPAFPGHPARRRTISAWPHAQSSPSAPPPSRFPPPTRRCRLGRPPGYPPTSHPQVSSRACREISASPAALLRDRRPPAGVILSEVEGSRPPQPRRREVAAHPQVRAACRAGWAQDPSTALRTTPEEGYHLVPCWMGARSLDCARDDTWKGMTPRPNAAGDARSFDKLRTTPGWG